MKWKLGFYCRLYGAMISELRSIYEFRIQGSKGLSFQGLAFKAQARAQGLGFQGLRVQV